MFKEITKRKFMDNLSGGLFGGQKNYIENLGKNIRKRVVDTVKQHVGGFREGLSQIETGHAMSEGVDKVDAAGGAIGGMVTGGIGKKIGSWVNKKFVSKSPKLQQMGKRLEQFHENLPRSIQEFRKSDKYQYDISLKGSMLRMLQEVLPGFGADTQFNKSSVRDLDKPSHFTKRTETSINEIIPGLLSHILRELQIVRTGNPNMDLIKYDHLSNRFTTKTKLMTNLKNTIVKENRKENLAWHMNKLINEIDKDKTMSPEVKDAIKMRMIENSTQFKEFKADNFTNSNKYKHPAKKEAAEAMDKYFSNAKEEDIHKATKLHNNIINTFEDPRDMLEILLNSGYEKELKQLGLITQDNTLSEDFYGKMHLDQGKDKSKKHRKQSNIPNRLSPVNNQHNKQTRQQPPKPKLHPTNNPSHNAQLPPTDAPIFQDKSAIAKMLELIEKNNQLTEDNTKSNKTELQEIKELLKTGVLLNGNQQNTNNNNIDPNQRFSFKKFFSNFGKVSKNIPKFDSTLPGIIANLVYRTTGAGIAGIKRLVKTAKVTSKMGLDNMKFTGNKIYGLLSKKLNDIYVANESKPRLYLAKLKAGEYYRAIDGKVITSIKDLYGDIKDAAGNIIISAEELSKLEFRNNGVITKLSKLGMKALGSIVNFSIDQFGKMLPRAMNM